MATLSVAAKNAALDAIVALFSDGGSPRIRLLGSSGSVTLSDLLSVTWGSASGGVVALNTPVTLSQQTNTGTADTLVLARPGFTEVSLTVGDPGSGADVEISPSAEIDTGTRVRITSLTLAIP